MRANHRQGLGRRPVDGERDRVDVLPLPGRDTLAELTRPRHRNPCLRHARTKLQHAGPRDMREGEVWVGRDGALELHFGADIRRQEEVDSGDVTGNRLG